LKQELSKKEMKLSIDKTGFNPKIVVADSAITREFVAVQNLSRGIPSYYEWKEIPGNKPVTDVMSFRLDNWAREG
jgi:hypothetical protein